MNKLLLLLASFAAVLLTACETTPHHKTHTGLRNRHMSAQGSEWGQDYTVLVRATAYPFGKHATDKCSRKGTSSSMIPLCYAAEKNVLGIAAASDQFPRGSIVDIQTKFGPRSYQILDHGSAVDSRKAARLSGKTPEERNAPVIDFCEQCQLWPDDFQIVTVHPYTGKPFDTFKLTERFAFREVAKKKFERQSIGRMLASTR